jgi:hypothetical protein
MTQDELKLALEALYPIAYNTTDDPRGQAYKAITAIKEALAQPEQEPVACGTYQEVTDTMNALWAGTLEQIQIAEEMQHKKLYTTPPQRTEHCQCPECKVTLHASDCAVHSEPAFPKGECNCGAQTQKPVAWLITDEKINSLQVDSIQRLIDRARHAHMTDIKLRINGQDEWHQADWLKHMVRVTQPQRTWVGLTRDEVLDIEETTKHPLEFYRTIEAKLKEKNNA